MRRVMGRRHVTANHHAHQGVARHVSGGNGRDQLAVAQHGDAVGDVERLLQRMRYEDDAGAALLQCVEEMEEMLRLLRRQRGRRLVENEHLRVMTHRPHDLDHLPLRGAERLDERERIDVEVERLQRLRRGDVDRAIDSEPLFPPKFEILRHCHRRHQTRFLINHGDAAAQRLLRRLELDLFALDEIFARSQRDRARDRLAKRRFAGAVLAEQGVDLACAQFKIDALDGVQTAIDFASLDYAKERASQLPSSRLVLYDAGRSRRQFGQTISPFGRREHARARYAKPRDAVNATIDAAVQTFDRLALVVQTERRDHRSAPAPRASGCRASLCGRSASARDS